MGRGAVLDFARPARPPLFGALPTLGTPPGRWMLETFGDDLAWVVGIDVPAVETPAPRKLHALWRKLLTNAIEADDPEIVALGPQAVAATTALLDKLRQ